MNPIDTSELRRPNPVTALLTGNGFIFALRILLAAIFIYSSLDKVQHTDAFAIAVRGYKLMPIEISNIFALLVAWSELVAGVMLLLGIMTQKAAAALFILLAMFIIALSTTIVRGIVVDCACFSNEGGHQTGYSLVIRNMFLLSGATMIILFDRGFWSLAGAFRRRR